MIFQSYLFILAFLPLVVLAFQLLNRFGPKNAGLLFLLLASYLFYGLHGVGFLLILLASTLFNFCLGRLLLSGRGGRALLAAGIAANVLALGYFKYTNFFLGSVGAALGRPFTALHILLPIGVSFFTLQQIAWLADAARGRAEPYSLLEYALHTAFFPYVLSGPITLHSDSIPALRQAAQTRLTREQVSRGSYAFAIGLFKKVLVADTLGAAANWGFAHIAGANTPTALLAMLAYTLQLYFDFSGYSNMARGCALLLGLDLPQNFDSPYQALTIQDFWRRWHKSLTRFLTEYIYIPLGGSRRGAVRTACNTAVVFLISGLWHGANWTFVLWGALHGLAMILNRVFKARVARLHPALSWFLTFGFVNLAWVFFRADSVGAAWAFLKNIARCDFGPIHNGLTACFALGELKLLGAWAGLAGPRFNLMVCLIFFALALVGSLQFENVDRRLDSWRPRALTALSSAVLIFWALVSLSGVSTFLYSNF